jgi:hypothetical protein
MLPDAPTLFSTTTGLPSLWESLGPTVRAIKSMPVPGVNGTINLMGAWLPTMGLLLLVFCANAVKFTERHKRTIKGRRFMI